MLMQVLANSDVSADHFLIGHKVSILIIKFNDSE